VSLLVPAFIDFGTDDDMLAEHVST
jgi:hypothetical protein